MRPLHGWVDDARDENEAATHRAPADLFGREAKGVLVYEDIIGAVEKNDVDEADSEE